jgi:uncharacterized protein YkwD
MKIVYKIIIIVFALGFLFVVRNDVVSILNNISSYLNKNIKTPIINLNEREEILPSKVNMPGALRVVDNFLNIKKIDLSKNKVILLTNEYRKKNNLPALKENKKLNLSAEKKLQDMFTNQYFEHISKTGKGVGDIGEEVGYEYILIGENLAMGNFKDDQSLIDAWIASEGHRKNIVNKNYTEIGMAVGKGEFEGKEIWMAVQHFGTPISVCPKIDQILYNNITSNQNIIKEMEDNLFIRRDNINKRAVSEGNTYNKQIDEYNNLITQYNNLIKDTKEKVNIYNEQIRLFNNCLLSLSE